MTGHSLLVRHGALLIGVGTALALTSGCSESVTAPVLSAPSNVVAEIVNTVYLPNFDSLATRCANLSSAIDALAATPNSTTLQAAQTAWRAARVFYERGEGFAFGPIETGNYDPSMDTWPVDPTGIDALVAGNDPITENSVMQLDGTLKGFHGIEYVLFGLNGSTTVGALSPRYLTYVSAAGHALADNAAALQQAWLPSGGDFSGQLINAGTSASVYASQGAALQEIIGGLVDPTDEVASSKIGQPLQTGSSVYEESRFSDNTIYDLHNDITGAEEAYFGGDSSSTGEGISAFVASVDPQTDKTVRVQFAEALAALDAVGPSFDAALHNNPTLLRNAQTAIHTLNQTLTQHVVPLVGSLEDEDGD